MLIQNEKNNEAKIHSIDDLENSHISLAIRQVLIKKVSEDILKEFKNIRELATYIRRKVNPVGVEKSEEFHEVAGVDAGSQVLPLASRRYGIISALVYSASSGRRFFHPPECIELPYTVAGGRSDGVINVRREAKLFETAYSFVQETPQTDLLLIDGPLAFSNLWSIRGSKKDQNRLVDAVNSLLRFCSKNNIAIAGIVKRPSARYLVYHLRLQDSTDLSDSFLLLHALKAGERTELFNPRAALSKIIRQRQFMDVIEHSIYSYYMRLSPNWAIPPFRIDIPAFSINLENEVASYCYWSSIWNGLPLPIARADEEVRISKRFISEVYSEMISYLGTRIGEVSFLAPFWGEKEWIIV
ncbi:DNA double-strand break repair nuclease NurA [Candidatus Bathyarchaeota archaeon]|nr:DNA double-strand break repair nuclease NurA [Candidatus Bathyarchaeota archaeon]MBS7629979.1 DNA double-strand break repair nuclease NurA [Candidatus Bathyarchaeota archaeon]